MGKLDCQKSVLDNVKAKLNYAEDCNCHSPCEDTKYLVKISQSEFPSESLFLSFWKVVLEDHQNKSDLKAYQFYQNLLRQNASVDTLKGWTYKHFLTLNVIANTNEVEVRKHIPMYTLVDLLCDVGRRLGLWLGISVIAIKELLDLSFQLSYWVVKSLVNVRKTNGVESHHPN